MARDGCSPIQLVVRGLERLIWTAGEHAGMMELRLDLQIGRGDGMRLIDRERSGGEPGDCAYVREWYLAKRAMSRDL